MGLFRRGMHFGSYTVAGRPEALFTLIGEAAATAEQAGFDALSVPDHVLQNDVGGGPDSPMLEAYTILGALAVRTTSARLLALVSPVTLRNPALLAKSVTTLDVISGGRAVLGIGAGWDATEHAAYGFDFPPVAERMDQLDEALGLCRSLFRQERTTFHGVHYRLADAPNMPPPLDGDIPILVGGSGEQRTLRLVARYADACNVFGDAVTVRHKFSVLDRHCEAVGRDPTEITRTVFLSAPGDPTEFQAALEALVLAGADGVVILGTLDLRTIESLGRTLIDMLPDGPKMG